MSFLCMFVSKDYLIYIFFSSLNILQEIWIEITFIFSVLLYHWKEITLSTVIVAILIVQKIIFFTLKNRVYDSLFIEIKHFFENVFGFQLYFMLISSSNMLQITGRMSPLTETLWNKSTL